MTYPRDSVPRAVSSSDVNIKGTSKGDDRYAVRKYTRLTFSVLGALRIHLNHSRIYFQLAECLLSIRDRSGTWRKGRVNWPRRGGCRVTAADESEKANIDGEEGSHLDDK